MNTYRQILPIALACLVLGGAIKITDKGKLDGVPLMVLMLPLQGLGKRARKGRK